MDGGRGEVRPLGEIAVDGGVKHLRAPLLVIKRITLLEAFLFGKLDTSLHYIRASRM